MVWNKTGVDKDIGVIDSLLIESPEDFEDYSFPAVPEDFIRRQCKWLEENKGDRFSVGMLGFSLFERAWTLCGMENLLCYMITDPDFTDALLDRICEYNLEIIRIAGDYAFNGFYFGDDWGQQKGLIMGPTHWRRFIRPRLERMYCAVREQSRVVIQHSCGDIREVMDDVIDLGLNIYQTFQPEIYDISAYQKKLKTLFMNFGSIRYFSPPVLYSIRPLSLQIDWEGTGNLHRYHPLTDTNYAQQIKRYIFCHLLIQVGKFSRYT